MSTGSTATNIRTAGGKASIASAPQRPHQRGEFCTSAPRTTMPSGSCNSTLVASNAADGDDANLGAGHCTCANCTAPWREAEDADAGW